MLKGEVREWHVEGRGRRMTCGREVGEWHVEGRDRRVACGRVM
tara:strand:+ start:635 stop:763 length:129 start_codon:yes stop_codon:yes gene_type:complete